MTVDTTLIGRTRGQRNPVVLISFTALTNLADGVTKVVLPLLAAQVTHAPGPIAGIGVTLTLPWLLVALPAGVLVDRFDRRLLLWIADGVRAASMGGLLVLTASGSLNVAALYVVGLVLGSTEVVAVTAAGAMIPAAVPERGRERTNAWIGGAETVCNEFAGPFVGGLLVATGVAAAVGITGVAYVVATALLLLLVGRFRPVRSEGPVSGVNRQVVEGLTFLWQQPVLRMMALVSTVLCACWGAWLAVIPAVAISQWGYSPQEYGYMMSALGIGGLVGAATVGRVNRGLGLKWALFADLVGTLLMVGAPMVSSHVALVACTAFAGGMGGVLWSVNARTISQSLVPDELLGRYNAAARLFSWGAMPVGGVIAGALVQWVGAGSAFAVFAVATASIMVPFLRVVRVEFSKEIAR
ncbi:MFS transporter [Nocardia terpenica]|uniref:MFS transporter n=1 Tax=Nocardia terpenica TaxID=455432 RepID=UPI0018948568|nr:MFS transporter [Nocardia terpenica]MBF6064631.1 MFS transporter [Nocardia terpenica]MBF6106745.1 MFS transporter [Nocardia terpenica]MBF6114599.1 MFS transporter [Nocardia terpenica]MBF6121315.1 MFS transporter [Nocardia terpenica]MBF6153730.1 MFS transporter [Nocardia terpenica]